MVLEGVNRNLRRWGVNEKKKECLVNNVLVLVSIVVWGMGNGIWDMGRGSKGMMD